MPVFFNEPIAEEYSPVMIGRGHPATPNTEYGSEPLSGAVLPDGLQHLHGPDKKMRAGRTIDAPGIETRPRFTLQFLADAFGTRAPPSPGDASETGPVLNI